MDRPTRRPAGASALDQAPAPLPFPADAIPYNLSIPTGWVSASGVSPGGAGRPKLGPRRPTPHRPFLA